MSFNEKYRGLSKRARIYLKYDRLNNFSTLILIVSFFGAFFSMTIGDFAPVLILYRFGSSSINILTIFTVATFISSFFASETLIKRRRNFLLTREEWLFLDIYECLENLGSYLKENNDYYRIEAYKKIEEAIRKVSEKWHVSPLKIVKKLVGNQVDTFKQNLEQKLLPAIQEGDRGDLGTSSSILEDIMIFLGSPTVEGLQNINLRMSELSTIPTTQPTIIERIKASQKIQHSLTIGGCISGGFLAYSVGFYLRVSNDTLYTVSFGTFCSLLIAYVGYLQLRMRK